MAINDKKIFAGWPAIFDGLTLQARSVTPSSEIEQLMLRGIGALGPQFTAVAGAKPKVTFKTFDLGTLLAGGVSPTNATNGLIVSTTGELQYRLRGGSGSAHVTLNSTKGFLCIDNFGADQDSKEGLDVALTYYPLRNGSNPPFVVNASQPLSGSPAVNTSYALGPGVLEGTQLKGITKMRVSTGIKYEFQPADGEIYSDAGNVSEYAFTLELECYQLEVMSALGFGMFPITSGFTGWFQRVKSGTTRYDYDEAQHVAATFTAGNYLVQEAPVDGEGHAMCKILITSHGLPTIAAGQTIVLP